MLRFVQDRYLITGPSGAGGRPHVDVSNQSFWNALLHGRKRWLFISEALLREISHNDPEAVATWMSRPEVAHSWYQSGGAEYVASIGAAGEQWWECIQEPAELVYGAGGMMHVVLSLDDSLSVSEQMFGPTNFRGSIGVCSLYNCDRNRLAADRLTD